MIFFIQIPVGMSVRKKVANGRKKVNGLGGSSRRDRSFDLIDDGDHFSSSTDHRADESDCCDDDHCRDDHSN
jgi:hypothetical protein